jgi:KUP system potassium uptake protein
MGGFVLLCMLSWHRGLEKQVYRHVEYTEPIEEFAARIDQAPLAEVDHTGIFFSRTGVMAPVPLERLANMLHMKFERVVIISIRIASRPRVSAQERILVTPVGDKVLKIEVRYGYQQAINIPATIGPALAEEGIDADEALYIIGHERVIGPMEPASLFDLMNIIFAFLAATAERAVDRFQLPPSRTLELGYPVHMKEF